MTRPGSRDHGRAPDTGRTPADYATTAPPADAEVCRCRCGAMYRDYEASHHAHYVVFGHRPIRKPAPATAESAPEQGAAQ